MMDADAGEQAKSAAMVKAERERKRLVKNARQRTMYGPTHRRRRAQFARRIERGDAPICPRCLLPIGPDQQWDLGHDDYDPKLTRPSTAGAIAALRTGC